MRRCTTHGRELSKKELNYYIRHLIRNCPKKKSGRAKPKSEPGKPIEGEKTLIAFLNLTNIEKNIKDYWYLDSGGAKISFI